MAMGEALKGDEEALKDNDEALKSDGKAYKGNDEAIKGDAEASSFTNIAFMRKLPSFTNFAFMRNLNLYMHLLQWRYFITCVVENRQPEWSVTWTQYVLLYF